jgi:hypothetical protein
MLWETGNTLSDRYLTRLILEILLWGGFAFLLEIASNIAGVALFADQDFPHGKGNNRGIYTVEMTMYTVVPSVRIVLTAFKMVVIAF